VRCTAHAWRGPAGARRAGAAPTAAWTSVPPPAQDMDSKLWIPPFSSLLWITKYKALCPNEALLDNTAYQYPRCTNVSNVAWLEGARLAGTERTLYLLYGLLS
jgi:hypothetical protein